MISKTTIRSIVLATAATVGLAGAAQAQRNPMVGGSPMFAEKNIVENAVNSKDHTTLVAAVKAADLVGTLSSPGPFTVFAPTNAAFAKLPAGTVESLVTPAMKPTLTKVLTYHVVPGAYSSAQLADLAKKAGGQAELKTAEGSTLAVIMRGKSLYVADNKGNTGRIRIANVRQSNGVIHVVDTVMMP